MKKIIYLIVLLLFIGCTKELTYQYDNIGRIYFEYETRRSNGLYVHQDSIVFSFGKHNADIQEDTARIVVKCMGDSGILDRNYKVKVVQRGAIIGGETTMEEGVHYKVLAPQQIFRAGRFDDTLKVILYRSHLSNSIRNPESRALILSLEANSDFELGIPKGREVRLTSNNTLNAPAWWEKNTVLLGFYHPKKWLLLIDLDPKFRIEPEFAGTGVDMQNKSLMLKDYLKKNVMIDEETGMRITFDGLVAL